MFSTNLFCLLLIKLYIPDGLENSDIKESVSPMRGHPVVPGIFAISLVDVHERNRRKHNATRVERSTSIDKVLRNSIAVCRQTIDETTCRQARRLYLQFSTIFSSVSETSVFVHHQLCIVLIEHDIIQFILKLDGCLPLFYLRNLKSSEKSVVFCGCSSRIKATKKSILCSMYIGDFLYISTQKMSSIVKVFPRNDIINTYFFLKLCSFGVWMCVLRRWCWYRVGFLVVGWGWGQ